MPTQVAPIADRFVRGDAVRRAVGDDAARVEHQHAVGEPAHDAEVVLDDEQRETLVAQ